MKMIKKDKEIKLEINIETYLKHCVKSVQMQSNFWSVFCPIRTKYGEIQSMYLSVFSPNAGKYGPENTPHLDTFHTVKKIRLKKRNMEKIDIIICLKKKKILKEYQKRYREAKKSKYNYRNLSEEYGKNRYHSMSGEKKTKIKRISERIPKKISRDKKV